jgi:hypothetical protein
MKTTIIKYDTKIYRFKELVEEVFNCSELNRIHIHRKDLFPGEELLSKPWPFNEATDDYYKTFYGKLGSGWSEMVNSYEMFVNNEISKLFDEDFLYQYFPSFRIHLPGLKAVNKWHYDSDDYHKHPDGEINFHLSVTDCFDTNAIWVESKPRKEDFEPIEMSYGQFAQFDGNKCTHGNKVNLTGKTRISFDFRILPISKYLKGKNKMSVTKSNKFEVNEYYKEIIV